MPITEEALDASVLGRAIDDASDKTVRAILKTICANNDEARKEAENRLLVLPTDSKEQSNTAKKPVPRYAFCVNCKIEFDITTSTEEKCKYHPREDLWVDNYDEFDVDTDEMREEFPHCFTFGCCDGNLQDNPDGCVIDFHQEGNCDTKPSKRARAF